MLHCFYFPAYGYTAIVHWSNSLCHEITPDIPLWTRVRILIDFANLIPGIVSIDYVNQALKQLIALCFLVLFRSKFPVLKAFTNYSSNVMAEFTISKMIQLKSYHYLILELCF